MSILPRIMPMDEAQQRARRERILMSRAAQIGGQLFGPVPKGHRRQFFCFDPNTWIWYEEWKDQNGRHAVTTRYIVRADGVMKTQDGHTFQPLSREEARNFYRATHLFADRVTADFQQAHLVA